MASCRAKTLLPSRMFSNEKTRVFSIKKSRLFSGYFFCSFFKHPTQNSIYWGWGLRCSVICQVLHINACATLKRKHSIYASSPAVLGDNHSCHTHSPAFIICEGWLCEYLWAYFTSLYYLSQTQWAELGAHITQRATAQLYDPLVLRKGEELLTGIFWQLLRQRSQSVSQVWRSQMQAHSYKSI